MHAAQIQEFGGPEVLGWTETDDLTAGPGEVLLAVEAAGVDYLVAVNPGCLRQWQTGLARRKSRIRAVHIADLLAAAAGGRALPQGLPLAARLPQVRLPSGMRVRRVFRLRKDAGAQNTDGWSA